MFRCRPRENDFSNASRDAFNGNVCSFVLTESVSLLTVAMSRYPPRRISLLVRNLPLDARCPLLRQFNELCAVFSPEELRSMFERYGDVRDVYLPRDYHTE